MKLRFPVAVAVMAALSAVSLCSAVDAKTLRVTINFPIRGLVTELLYPFEKSITKATGGDISFHNSGVETVPPFEQFQPLTQGVFDLLQGVPGYHQAQTGVGSVLDSLIKIEDTKAMYSSGLMDWLNNYYRKNFGVFILSIYRSGPGNFVLREPLSGDTRLNGRKIRTNATYEGIVRELGGAPVSMAAADAYAAMQKGTLDGVTWPVTATADYNLYEVAKYMTKPRFGGSANYIMMNAASFDALTKEQQKIFLDAGRKLDRDGKAYFDTYAQTQDDIMLKNGVHFTEFTPGIAAKINKLYLQGVLSVARRSRPKDVDALLKFATSVGMLETAK